MPMKARSHPHALLKNHDTMTVLLCIGELPVTREKPYDGHALF